MKTRRKTGDKYRLPVTNRRPLRRLYAEKYLVWMLLSFAVSISMTRLFLEITGYPQIGSHELHIAHVLWGGMFLFAASILPIIFANRWVYMASAILGGIGIGLFIDEVGKFITQTNDYFYPPAAPIIYVFFLITFLIYTIVRRPVPRDVRSEFYYIFEELEEVLDHDFSDEERKSIQQRLDHISANNSDPIFARLALELADFINSKQIQVKPDTPGFVSRLKSRLVSFENKILNHNRYRGALVGGLLSLGIWGIRYPVSILSSVRNAEELASILSPLVAQGLVRGSFSLSLYSVRLGLEGSFSLILIITAVMLALGKDRKAMYIGYFTLLTSLTVVNPLLFYFEQLSMIITAMLQFVLMLLLVRYRKLYLPELSEITI